MTGERESNGPEANADRDRPGPLAEEVRAGGEATPLTRLKMWIEQRPAWLHASLWLAIGLAAYGAVRAVLRLLQSVVHDATFNVTLGDFARIPAMAAFGFAIGLAWSAFGPLRRRGGAMVVVANMLTLLAILLLLAALVVIPAVFGD